MIFVNELFADTESIVNPIQSGFFLDKFNSYMNMASRDFFDELTGRRQQYNAQGESVTGGFQKTFKITDSLFPFIRRRVVQVDSNGLMIVPDDYAYFSDMRVRYDEGELFKCACNGKNDVDCADLPNDPSAPTLDEKIRLELAKVYPEGQFILTDINKIADILDSTIYKPTKRLGICYPLTEVGVTANLNKSYFQLLPKNVGSGILTYLRLPKDGDYATTTDPDTQDNVYDPTNSLQLEWDKKNQNDLVVRIAQYYGVFITKQDLINSALQQIKNP
jgi:hypothetical protein